MISINGHYLLYAFLLLFAGGVFFSLSHLYHAIRFGGRDPLSVATTGIFIAGLITISWLTLFFLSNVNWSTSTNVSVPAFHVGLPSPDNLHL